MGVLAQLFGLFRRGETAKEMSDRFNREFRERLEREENMPVLENGKPNIQWYRREGKRLSDLGRWEQAEAILTEGRILSQRAGVPSLEEKFVAEIDLVCHAKLVDSIGANVLSLIADRPDGIMQADLYALLPEQDEEVSREACYRLARAGKITRKKKARSYMLRLVEQDKLE